MNSGKAQAPKTKRIAIVGAGLSGSLLSFRLVNDGYMDVTVFEQDPHSMLPNQYSSPAFIAGGMLAPYIESVAGGKLIFELGVKSASLWDGYLSSLGIANSLNKKGSLILANGAFKDELQHFMAKVKDAISSQLALLQSLNNKMECNLDFYTLCNRDKIQNLEPELKFNYGVFIPDESNLNASLVMQKLREYLLNKQTICYDHKVEVVDCAGGLTYGGQLLNFDLIIDCRGIGATSTFPDLRGIRGEIIKVYAPDVHLSRPVTLFHPRQRVYIVPYPDHTYLIGATEIEANDTTTVSVRSAVDLLSYACNIHSGFWEARILELNSNLRPTLPDSLPQIKQNGKLIAINGLYRHGFLLAPAIIEDVVCYINSGTMNIKEIWRNECK